eukprot:TRINITY_DN27614_c0_g1_i1.p2 TRINITY_DN27614_c0_g1~~TRINITY_DN27614_c0_g1_i1.p2  ORF type:complete len:290 (+),score=45.70 TRINITY_DN27614_c0_g1_i1:44-871(+)
MQRSFLLWAVVTWLSLHGECASAAVVPEVASEPPLLLRDGACRERLKAKTAERVDGCGCLLSPEVVEGRRWAVQTPRGLELRWAGTKGVGIFATRPIRRNAEIGRAPVHVLPCQDLHVDTPLGARTAFCETHFYDLQCESSQVPGRAFLQRRPPAAQLRERRRHGRRDIALARDDLDRNATADAEASTQRADKHMSIGIFPEWLAFLNHADSDGATTYHGQAVFQVNGFKDTVDKEWWTLIAGRDIAAGEELTIDYRWGDWTFQALTRIFQNASS